MSTALRNARTEPVTPAARQAAEFAGRKVWRRYLLRCFRHWALCPTPPCHPVRVARWDTVQQLPLHSWFSLDAHTFGLPDIDSASIVQGEFQYWQQLLGGFDLDMFTSATSALLPDFGSKVRPFNTLDLCGRCIWAFLPRHLVMDACTTILSAVRDFPQTTGLVLVPCDTHANW